MFELNNIYDSYEPKKYKRTYSLYDSFYMDENVRIQVSAAGSSLSIKMGFDDGAIHSGFYGDKVNTAVLLNEGYQTHGSFKDVPYLGFREPTHFIEKGINRYKQKVNKPFTVKVTINDEVRVF